MHQFNPNILEINEVWHIGSMDESLRGSNRKECYEGHCLSVSTEPEKWIAILNAGNSPLWKLKKQNAKFLDYYALTDANKQTLRDWGVENGYVICQPGWLVSTIDFETGDIDSMSLHRDYDSAEDALADLKAMEAIMDKDPSADIEETDIYVPTSIMTTHTIHEPRLAYVDDYLSILYAEKVLGLDGVWWQDMEHKEIGQAPRGGIFPIRLVEWTIERV